MPKALAHLTHKHAPIKEYHGGRFQMPHVLYRASLGKVDQSKRWQKIWKKKKKKRMAENRAGREKYLMNGWQSLPFNPAIINALSLNTLKFIASTCIKNANVKTQL